MPQLLEPPSKSPNANLIPFNHARAVEAGRKSGQARREAAALKDWNLTPDSQPGHVQAVVNAQLALVADQITRTRVVLDDTRCNYCPCCERAGIEPHHRAQLLKALDTLLDRQRKLLGIADPAPMKQGRQQVRREPLTDWVARPAPAPLVVSSTPPVVVATPLLSDADHKPASA